MKTSRGRTVALASAFAIVSTTRVAYSHPLGQTSINRYAGVRPRASDIEVDYLLDLAELPAWSEIESLDTDHDGTITPSERDAYLFALTSRLGLTLRVGDHPVALRPVFQTIEAPEGQGGLSTLRVAYTFRSTQVLEVPVGATLTVTLTDTTWSDRNGWREIDPDPSQGYTLVSSSLPRDAPRAGAALGYPAAPLRLPREDTAVFVFHREGTAAESVTPRRVSLSRGASSPELSRLVSFLRASGDRPSAGFIVFALAVAAALGAGHALGPGHGKALAGAWLVGTRARARDALLLGVVVTITHTAVVFAMALVALAVEHTFGTERLLRAMELTAALLVIGIALRQLNDRWRAMRVSPMEGEHEHSHLPPGELGLRALVAVGVSGGMVPCPSALLVLLTAVGIHRVALGIGLLGAFSLGLASVLTLVGIVAVYAREWLQRGSWTPRWARWVPVVSSLAVLVLGVGMLVRGLLGR